MIPAHPIPTRLLPDQIKVYHHPKIGINTNLSESNFGKLIGYTTHKIGIDTGFTAANVGQKDMFTSE